MTGTEADNWGARDTDLFCERHKNHYEVNFHHYESGETEHFSEPRETEEDNGIHKGELLQGIGEENESLHWLDEECAQNNVPPGINPLSPLPVAYSGTRAHTALMIAVS